MPTWEKAREEVLANLLAIRQLVERQDEPAILELVNQQDAFCDAAQEEKSAAPGHRDELMCSFCRGFMQAGGCGELVKRINQAVMNGQWDEAGRATDEYIAWVRRLDMAN